jgi:hypothetical protein
MNLTPKEFAMLVTLIMLFFAAGIVETAPVAVTGFIVVACMVSAFTIIYLTLKEEARENDDV